MSYKPLSENRSIIKKQTLKNGAKIKFYFDGNKWHWRYSPTPAFWENVKYHKRTINAPKPLGMVTFHSMSEYERAVQERSFVNLYNLVSKLVPDGESMHMATVPMQSNR